MIQPDDAIDRPQKPRTPIDAVAPRWRSKWVLAAMSVATAVTVWLFPAIAIGPAGFVALHLHASGYEFRRARPDALRRDRFQFVVILGALGAVGVPVYVVLDVLTGGGHLPQDPLLLSVLTAGAFLVSCICVATGFAQTGRGQQQFP